MVGEAPEDDGIHADGGGDRHTTTCPSDFCDAEQSAIRTGKRGKSKRSSPRSRRTSRGDRRRSETSGNDGFPPESEKKTARLTLIGSAPGSILGTRRTRTTRCMSWWHQNVNRWPGKSGRRRARRRRTVAFVRGKPSPSLCLLGGEERKRESGGTGCVRGRRAEDKAKGKDHVAVVVADSDGRSRHDRALFGSRQQGKK
jgi:hypothetical protein